MSKLKYMLGALGLSMALLMTGCGTSGGSNGQTSAAEESAAAENAKTDSSQTDAEQKDADQTDTDQANADTKKEEEKKEPSHDLTGSDDPNYIKDTSYEVRSTAEKGSLEKPLGRYELKDADGVFYYFDGESTCYYVQKGTYSFSHDASTDGTDEDMISMQFDAQETPTNYIIDQEDGALYIRTTYSGAEAETKVAMKAVSGTDGIADMENFEGIYTAYGMDNYRYEFHADGTFYLVLDEAYTLGDDNTVTLSAFDKDFTYTYAENGGNLELSGDGTVIATLVPNEL